MPLLAVPNVSEGSDRERLALLESAFTEGATLLDRHTDPDHGRTVFTLAGSGGRLTEALARGAEVALETIEMGNYRGVHPAIGALDVCPVVWFDPADRNAARAEAVSVATQVGGLGVPVFLYGELARDPGRAERAYFRNGGLGELWLRMEAGELRPDFGPPLPHRTAGATLVTARPPLAAFNVELDSGDVEVARVVAAGLREAGGGLSGVRAIGLLLSSGRAQVSTNVHDPFAVPLGEVVERVRELAAPLGARPLEAELVGLVPRAALAGYPAEVPIRSFDPHRHTIEARLADATDQISRLLGWKSDAVHSLMAQTKKKRRRKQRGTQGGRVDTSPRKGRPRSREEAKARARSRRKPAPKQDLPPTWRNSMVRGLFAAVIFAVLLIVLFKKPVGASLIFGAFMLAFYVPAGYYIDMAMWRRRERARIRARGE